MNEIVESNEMAMAYEILILIIIIGLVFLIVKEYRNYKKFKFWMDHTEKLNKTYKSPEEIIPTQYSDKEKGDGK